MCLPKLTRSPSGCGNVAVVVLVVVPIAIGLTAAFVVDGLTDSRRDVLWVGSAVTVTVTSIIHRLQNRR